MGLLTCVAVVFSVSFTPLPDMAGEIVQANIVQYLPKVAHTHRVSHTKSTLKRIARLTIRKWKRGGRPERHMSRDDYAMAYRDELKKRGKPDETQFLISIIPGESKWNPMAVSYLPPKRMKNGKMSPPLWHCGVAQHQCKTQGCCRKFQTDPRFAAKDDLRLLRYFDKYRGHKDCSRVCNWKSGPGSDRCRGIRETAFPGS